MGTWVSPKISSIGPAGRGGHACCVLDNGHVIVYGGADRSPTVFEDLWVLEPGEEFVWTQVAANSKAVGARSGATLTVVDGSVYLFGGQHPLTGMCFNDLHVLDTSSWTWRSVQVSSKLPPPRHSHVAVCLQNHCLVVHGGASQHSTPLDDVWLFNAREATWQLLRCGGAVPAAREMHAAVAIDSTRVMLHGGRSGDGRVLSDAAVLSLDTTAWQAAVETPYARCAHSMVAMPAHAASPATTAGMDVNQQASDMQASSTARESTAQRVVLFGGFDGTDMSNSVAEIDVATMQGRAIDDISDPPVPRFAHAATVVPYCGTRSMLVFGGATAQEDLSDVVLLQST